VRALITGAAGFVGAHLAAHLIEAEPGAAVWGMVWPSAGRESVAALPSSVHIENGELRDAGSLQRVLRVARPEVIFHLAAASTVASSWAAPTEAMEVNAVGQINLLEGIRALGLEPTVIVACSAEAYGRAAHCPVTEDAPLAPLSPYAVSKAAQDLIAAQYHAAYGLKTIRLRLFNHTGPGRPERFVASSFARQTAEIERGMRPPVLRVGNLDAVRDFTDVRDVVRAYRLVAANGWPGAAYNVCSGAKVSVRELLDILLAVAGVEVEVKVDPELLRPADIPALWGDRSRLTADTGWQPLIPLERTLADLLAWWRGRLDDGVAG
jgi:GDP-4-dehydro-6-deoxy-D-mannose reductase